MSRTPYDQFSKQYLEELLTPLGEVAIGKEVLGEARQVDVFFSPTSESVVAPQIGLLSRFATTACLLEPFRNQPSPTEIRDCLLKLFLSHAELQRQAKRNNARLQEGQLPRLWILASSASENLLNGFRAQSDETTWGQGVYLLGESLRAAIVAINQLPTTTDTLWLRILGKGRTQQQAIDELVNLPRENLLRSKALELLFTWSISIESREDLNEEDQALIMQLSPLYRQRLEESLEQGRQAGMQAGIQAGIQAGMQAERRATVENLLEIRFGSLDEELRVIIEPILQLSTQEYSRLLLQLPTLSRDELLARLG